MRELFLIIKKELLELLRDRKTIINSILLPTLIMPIIILGFIKITEKITQNEQHQIVEIGLLNAPGDFAEFVKSDTLNKVTSFKEKQDFEILINDKSVHIAIVFPTNWNILMDNYTTAEVKVFRNGSFEVANKRVSNLIKKYNDFIKERRIFRLQIPVEQLIPIDEVHMEVGQEKELLGKRIGGFIPYLFILSMWSGCLLAGIDLVTGEKERKTIETTISLPISKFTILMGKTIVAALLGFIPALFSLIGLILGLKFVSGVPDTIKSGISEMLNFQSVTLFLLLLIPFSMFLSGLIIALIVGATSFKEAQSRAAPIMLIVVFPLLIAILPSMELNWTTVFIPILNIGLGLKEIAAGTINMLQFAVILISLIAFAIGVIYISYRKFSDENAILN